jgi:hypothetical protein
VTTQAGLAQEHRFISWGTGLVDLDNYGYPDILVVTGNVYPELEPVYPNYPRRGPRLIFRNVGNGKFIELGSDEFRPGQRKERGHRNPLAFRRRGNAQGNFCESTRHDSRRFGTGERAALCKGRIFALNEDPTLLFKGEGSLAAARLRQPACDRQPPVSLKSRSREI